jgi:broad-specificity NMP kinase
MARRIMFVQLKTGYDTDRGPSWVGWVDFNRSWGTARFQLSGPKRDQTDTRYVCGPLDTAPMGLRNFLIEGVSGTGKTAVCHELRRRGHDAVNGDRELAYQGDPETGEVTDRAGHEHHVWDVSRVRALVADHRAPVTFFCGGSRNFAKFIDLFDGVFVLDVDVETLLGRLDQRPADEWGADAAERELIVRLHHTREDIPRTGVVIDATPPLAEVVDEILRQVQLADAETDTE